MELREFRTHQLKQRARCEYGTLLILIVKGDELDYCYGSPRIVPSRVADICGRDPLENKIVRVYQGVNSDACKEFLKRYNPKNPKKAIELADKTFLRQELIT